MLARATRTRSRQLLILSAALFAFTFLSVSSFPSGITSQGDSEITVNASKLPMSFEANGGQTDPSVRFLARSSDSTLFFLQSEVVLSLQSPAEAPSNADDLNRHVRNSQNADFNLSDSPTTVRLKFVGANPSPQIDAGQPLPGKVSYLLGNDPSRWQSDLSTYSSIKYSNLYPGIDLKYEGDGGHLKGTYTVATGADPTSIVWRYNGANSLLIDEQGNLQIIIDNSKLKTQNSKLIEQAPVAWQEIEGKHVVISARYQLGSDNSISFAMGDYDPSYPLTIDPTLTYSTYLGGNSVEIAEGVAVDSSGNIYVSGYTASPNFPTANAYQPNLGGGADVFVTKFDPTGSTLIYSTYIGGSNTDLTRAMALDAQGNVVVTGRTASTDYPVANAYQPANGGYYDLFVTKLNSSGSGLVFSTYLGGTDWDEGFGIDADGIGNVYLTGSTSSANFPTANPIQPTRNGREDAFVSKLSANGAQLVYSTFLGGSDAFGGEVGNDIAVDATGQAYVVGTTANVDFPIFNAFQPTYGGGEGDAFVTKINAAGSAFVYSTFLGGQDTLLADTGNSIAVDASASVYVTGLTSSPNFPLAAPFQFTLRGDADVFVTKFNASGTSLAYSTFLGGTNDFQRLDEGAGIAINAQGEAYIVGTTQAPDFPIVNPVQPSVAGSHDAFVTKFNAAGSALVYSTYLGGNGQDEGHAIAVSQGNAYAVGYSFSSNFPTVNPFQPQPGGSFDGFVSRITEPQSNTPTPTQVVTNTPTSTPTTALAGHVIWQGRPAQPSALQQLPISLTLKSGSLEMNYPVQATDATGVFTVGIGGLPSGTYNWRVKGPKFLANSGTVELKVGKLDSWRVENVTVNNLSTFQLSNFPTTNLEMGLMRTSDANNDNVINASDFSILKGTFGKSVGDPGYDDRGDFNGDQAVNVVDFNFLKGNFGQGGAPPIGPSKP